MAFDEEDLALLKWHGIQSDERFVFERASCRASGRVFSRGCTTADAVLARRGGWMTNAAERSRAYERFIVAGCKRKQLAWTEVHATCTP
jgi:hypothetical protein